MLGVLLVVSVITALSGPVTAGRLRGMMHWAFAHFGDAGMYLTTRVKGMIPDSQLLSEIEAAKLSRENSALKRRVDSLESKILRQNRILTGVTTGSVFSKLFGPDSDTPVKLISARVVAADSLPYGFGRLLNAGSRNGAADGLAVTTRTLWTNRRKKLPQNFAILSDSAFVGKLMETKAFTARMQMVNDRGFKIVANIHRRINPRATPPRKVQFGDRMKTLTAANNFPISVYACGDGATGLIVSNVPRRHNILPGDVLRTKPNDALLPAIIEIGVVDSVTPSPKHSGMVNLHVKPSADLPSLREVYIVVPQAAPAAAKQRGKKRGAS